MPFSTTEEGGVLWVTLEHPPLNVLDVPLIEDLAARLSALFPREDLKVIVWRSALPRIFSAGVDIRDHSRERAVRMLGAFHGLVRTLLLLPQASIASVDGACLGGGCELAAACDFLLATGVSSFGQPEINVGCFPPAASVLLPRLVGRSAAGMILTGAPLSAGDAAGAGLVTRVVEDLPGETERLARSLAEKSRAVLSLARRALLEGSYGSPLEALDRVEALYTEELLKTADAEEGVRAFLEKRPPSWKDR
jgi:cyclohexa-1,5-dienecarbonyl-CoA hydratase